MFILFPGRHQLLTTFQHSYLNDIVSGKKKVSDIAGNVVDTSDITAIIFAVTSANHSNTRRNPLPFYIRALAVQEFSRDLPVPAFVYGIDDIGQARNFSSYTLKRIHHESESMFDLTPENTLVLCSTPVLEMYEEAGFRILPGELVDRKIWKHNAALPWDIVEQIAADDQWINNNDILKSMHPSSISIWEKYRLGDKVRLLFRDKMISDDGDITTTRDYNTYVRQMDEIAGLKYNETAPHIRPGRIGDIGCAVGSWMKLACDDVRFRESDFYGIEVARHLFDICQQRKHNGEFKNPFVFFSQRNAVTGLVFDKSSMNTIHTSSLTHEIESYGSREELLQFIRNRYDELAPGGVWVNRDVVGPVNRDEIVLMKLNNSDGRNDDYNKNFNTREELASYLTGLSTYGRFLRFAHDFRKKEGYNIQYSEVKHEGQLFIRISLKDGCEFISRKDYVDNWESEMHETFCFWDFDDWTDQLTSTGFRVLPESAAYTNTWLVKNRFKGKAEFFHETTEGPIHIPYPVTNMLMIAEKR